MRCKELQFFRVQLLKELEALDHPHSLAEIPTLEEGTQDILDQANAEHEKSLFFHFLERQGYAVQEIGQASKGIGMSLLSMINTFLRRRECIPFSWLLGEAEVLESQIAEVKEVSRKGF
jgi:hypothetical protein